MKYIPKKCIKCKSDSEFLYVNCRWTTKKGTNQNYICRKCNTHRIREYRKTPSGKEALMRAFRKYEEKNKARRQAWSACQHLGMKSCEICGTEKTDKHHPDITKPLEVVWLCRLHHMERHRKEKAVDKKVI